MTIYKFGDVECKISFNDFLVLILNNDSKFFKSDFKDFSELYEFIEKNKMKIYHIIFDGYEYLLENGLLHNLYDAATIKHCEDKSSYFQGTIKRFYIDGKKVYDALDDRGCKNISDFKNNDIFHFVDITGKKSGRDNNGNFYRRKENVDYKIYPINLKSRIDKDQRKKKLKQINNRYESNYIR